MSGFSNIAKYIKNKSRGRLDLDDSLSEQEIAQSIAYDFVPEDVIIYEKHIYLSRPSEINLFVEKIDTLHSS